MKIDIFSKPTLPQLLFNATREQLDRVSKIVEEVDESISIDTLLKESLLTLLWSRPDLRSKIPGLEHITDVSGPLPREIVEDEEDDEELPDEIRDFKSFMKNWRAKNEIVSDDIPAVQEENHVIEMVSNAKKFCPPMNWEPIELGIGFYDSAPMCRNTDEKVPSELIREYRKSVPPEFMLQEVVENCPERKKVPPDLIECVAYQLVLSKIRNLSEYLKVVPPDPHYCRCIHDYRRWVQDSRLGMKDVLGFAPRYVVDQSVPFDPRIEGLCSDFQEECFLSRYKGLPCFPQMICPLASA